MLFILWLSKQNCIRGKGTLSFASAETYARLLKNDVQHQMGCAILHKPERAKKLANMIKSNVIQAKRKRLGLRKNHLIKLWQQNHAVRESTREACTNWALVVVAWSLLARGGEMCNILTQDVTFHKLSSGVRYATVMLAPLKKRASPKIPQLIEYIHQYGDWQPYVSLKRLCKLAKGSKAPADAPLFMTRKRRGTYAPISVADFRCIVRRYARMLQLPPEEFGAHSMRIGGATDLFSSNASNDITVIVQHRGRWSSDIYKIYTRITRRAHLSASRMMFEGEGRSMEEIMPSFTQQTI